MTLDRMSRNDFILLAFFVSMLSAIVLVAFAPVADEATLTMRVWAIAGSPISIGVVSTFIAAFAGTWAHNCWQSVRLIVRHYCLKFVEQMPLWG